MLYVFAVVAPMVVAATTTAPLQVSIAVTAVIVIAAVLLAL